MWFIRKHDLNDSYKAFAIGWMLVLIFDLVLVVRGLIEPVNNNWLYNFAFPLIHLLCLWFLNQLLRSKLLVVAICLFSAFAIYNWKFLQGPDYLNTYSLALGGVFIFLAAAALIYKLWKEDTARSLFSDPDFWICTAFIIYWGIETPFFTLYNFLYKNFENFFVLYFSFVHLGITIVLNICIIKALRCKQSTQRK